MPRQRGVVGSLPETLDFDHGSVSANAIIDQQICWNNMRNPAENQLPDFMLTPSHVNSSYVNSIDNDQQHLTGWSLGEPSSSGAQNEVGHGEHKMEHGRSSSGSACPGLGPRLDERRYETTNVLALDSANVNPQFVQSVNPNAVTHDLNLNAGFVGHGGDNSQIIGGSDIYKASGMENERIPRVSGSDAYPLPSGSGGLLTEVNDGRPGCSLDGYRQSCKRKALEGNVGQSSMGGSPSLFQRSGSSSCSGIPFPYNPGSSLSISGPSEQGNSRLRPGVRGLDSDIIHDSGTVGRGESSHRNFRLRMNPANQESVPSVSFSNGSAVRRPVIPSPHRSSRALSLDHSLDFRSSSVPDSSILQSQPDVIPVPGMPQNLQSFRWNESSSLRAGSSSSSIASDVREEGSSRNNARNILEHPMFVPATELRSSARNPYTRSVIGGNGNVPGIVPGNATSRSSIQPLPAPTWAPHPNPPTRNSRRLAEYVRRSLFSSAAASESGGLSSNHSPVQLGPPASSEQPVLPAGASNLGLPRSYPRSASWMDRQGDGMLGIPYPLRTLTSAGEGRSRLVVSEIRNVLDLMRRGENLRLEDVMILDQSVFFGMADIHDRHRDLRLDVDNMSYEELLALEERIGNVSTGLSEDAILNRLKQRKYFAAARAVAETEVEPCCVCQEEYNDGEDLGILDCGHDFHAGCIKQWLAHKNWCPICKTTGLSK